MAKQTAAVNYETAKDGCVGTPVYEQLSVFLAYMEESNDFFNNQ